MPTATSGMIKYFDFEGQGSPEWEKIGCGQCLNHVLLFTSLPKASRVEKGSLVSSWYRGICWECANCGQQYETLVLLSNRPVKERDFTLTRSSRRWVYGFLATHMLTMLQGISFIGRHSKKEVNG